MYKSLFTKKRNMPLLQVPDCALFNRKNDVKEAFAVNRQFTLARIY